MSEFVDSLCILNAEYTFSTLRTIYFTLKTTIDNQERMMDFNLTLVINGIGETIPFSVYAHKEKHLSEASEEEREFRENIKKYQNELFERLKQENSIRLHALFL